MKQRSHDETGARWKKRLKQSKAFSSSSLLFFFKIYASSFWLYCWVGSLSSPAHKGFWRPGNLPPSLLLFIQTMHVHALSLRGLCMSISFNPGPILILSTRPKGWVGVLVPSLRFFLLYMPRRATLSSFTFSCHFIFQFLE